MARTDSDQLNVRSKFARDRATQIAEATGMTTTQVVEEALRGYVPTGGPQPIGRLVREGRLLVMRGGRKITLEETDAAIEEARNLGHNYVGTEHLLLGLVRVEDRVVADTLAAFGLEHDALRAAVAEAVRKAG